jgi:hypothetical protein
MTWMRSAPAGRAATATVVTAMLFAAAPAFAGPGRRSIERPLAVSVPTEAAELTPGAVGTIPVRVVNPGPAAVTVRIRSRRVEFGDDGRVSVAGPDPAWARRVRLPSGPITVGSHAFRDIGVTVHMPAHISPDLYFVGFLVTPEPSTRANLTYVNQIGSYLTIDVPGPRTRTLAAALDVPRFAFSGGVRASLRVENVGRAAAVFWGENDTAASPGASSPRQQRLDNSLLPPGRSRTIEVTAKPSFLFARVTMRVRIFYPGTTASTTREIVLTRHVVVVKPAAAVVAGAAVLLIGAWFGVRRIRRRRATSHRTRSRARARTDAAARVDRALARTRMSPVPASSAGALRRGR